LRFKLKIEKAEPKTFELKIETAEAKNVWIKCRKDKFKFAFYGCHPQFQILFASLIKSSIAVVYEV